MSYRMVKSPIVLLNALPHREVYVLHKNRPKKLPKVSPPVLVEDSRHVADLEIASSRDEAKNISRKGSPMIKVTETLPLVSKPFILNDLPKVDGVLYLVEPETLARFPYRKDFVTPSAFHSWHPKKWDKALKSKNKKTRMRARKKMIKKYPFEKRFPLASIQYGPIVAAGPKTPRLVFN